MTAQGTELLEFGSNYRFRGLPSGWGRKRCSLRIIVAGMMLSLVLAILA